MVGGVVWECRGGQTAAAGGRDASSPALPRLLAPGPLPAHPLTRSQRDVGGLGHVERLAWRRAGGPEGEGGRERRAQSRLCRVPIRCARSTRRRPRPRLAPCCAPSLPPSRTVVQRLDGGHLVGIGLNELRQLEHDLLGRMVRDAWAPGGGCGTQTDAIASGWRQAGRRRAHARARVSAPCRAACRSCAATRPRQRPCAPRPPRCDGRGREGAAWAVV